MNKSDSEIWKTYPEFDFIQGSNLGRVRTVDRIISNGKGTYVRKGRFLKQRDNGRGYMRSAFTVGGKTKSRYVHRIIAKTFLSNPDNLPEVNHRDNNPLNNNVSNLEWCSHEYNVAYREKYGKPSAEVSGRPVYAVNLETLEILRFESQSEAGRVLEVTQGNISGVVKGRYKQANGFWFTENKNKIDEDKLRKIANNMPCKNSFYAVNLKTKEVSQFKSQHGASRELGVAYSNINRVLRGQSKQTHGYWFTYANENAVENIKDKFGDEVARKVEQLMSEKDYN